MVGVRVREGARDGIGLAVTVSPGEALAHGSVGHVVRTVVHRQVQGVHAGAAVLVGVRVRVGAGNVVCQAGAVRPGEALAHGGVSHVVRAVVHRQIIRYGAVTASG